MELHMETEAKEEERNIDIKDIITLGDVTIADVVDTEDAADEQANVQAEAGEQGVRVSYLPAWYLDMQQSLERSKASHAQVCIYVYIYASIYLSIYIYLYICL
jgi:hypothetical protein